MTDVLLRLIKLKKRGFCCAQILLILGLEAQGKTNPDLVRSMGGLCFGIAEGGEICGALSGGACLISLYAGKGGEEEQADARQEAMLAELAAWFRHQAEADYGGTRCGEILGRFPDYGKCGQIVAETYGKCLEILNSHGLDPAIAKGR